MKQPAQSLARGLARVPPGWWVVVLTLPALVPLTRGGLFESHDGLYHAYRLAALDRAVRAGVLYPRWFPELAFGYGHPVLNFYGPLSYFVGLPFALLGSGPALALELVFALGLLLSSVGMYHFARLHLDHWPSVVAAVVYAILPYHLIDVYVRGALAESLAFVWLPLVLYAFHRLIEDDPRPSIGRERAYPMAVASVAVAALLITHGLSTLVFAPVFAGYTLVLLFRRRERGAVVRVVLALAVSVVISSFYWLPVLVESRYVGLGHGASQGYRDHLVGLSGLISISPAYRYLAEGGSVLAFPLGLVQVVVLLLALVLPTRSGRLRWVAIFFLVVAYVSSFMLTTASLPIWQSLESILALLQYPWRFQLLTALATAFLCGALAQWLAPSRSWRRTAAVLLLLIPAGVWALWHLPARPVVPDFGSVEGGADRWVEAMWRNDQEAGQVGTTWAGEYLPIWVSEQRWALSVPTSEPVTNGNDLAAGLVELIGVGYGRYDFAVAAPQGTTVALHQFYYPGWVATDHTTGIRYSSHPIGALGLAACELPPISGTVTLRLAWTVAQWWGTLISAVALLGLSVATIARRGLRPWRKMRSTLGFAASISLVAGILLGGLAWPHGSVTDVTPTNAVLRDPVTGAPSVELLSFSSERTSYRPGDTVSVTLYWRALRNLDQNYKSFVHMTDTPTGQLSAQHDGDPGGGYSPTSRWIAGEVVPDRHHLALAPDLRPGRYRLWAGMYEYETVRNLTVTSSEAPMSENSVLLGAIEVLGP